jgi:quercetin dioxygenase-like cupin family protein
VARPGDEIVNVNMGARIVFRRTTEETRGEFLQFDFFLRPHKGVASEHIHPRQVESFKVMAGTMRGRMSGEERSVANGGSVAVPAGTPHIWWNDSEGEAHLLVEFRPALKTEVFFETVFGLARTGKAREDGLPKSILQMAVLLDSYRDEINPLRIPAPVRTVMVNAVAPVARRLGYRERYPEFSPSPIPGGSRG